MYNRLFLRKVLGGFLQLKKMYICKKIRIYVVPAIE